MTLIVRTPRPRPSADLTGTSPVWLMDIEYAGRTLRYSTRPVNVTSRVTGDTLRYLGALPALSVEERTELLAAGDTPIAPRASVEILTGEDIARLVGDGHRLDTAYCRIAWWIPGDDYEDRQVVVEGYLRGPSYGGSGEPIVGTIEPEPPTNDDTILQRTWQVGPDTEPVSVERIDEEDGTLYPLVFGSPGFYEDRTVGLVTIRRGAPAYRAVRWTRDVAHTDETVSRLLLGYGHFARLGDVWFLSRNADDGANNALTEVRGINLERTQDELGQPITTAEILTEATASERTAKDWYAMLDQPQESGPHPAGVSVTSAGLRSYTITIAPGGPDETMGPLRRGDTFLQAELDVSIAFDGGEQFRIGDSRDADRFVTFSDLDLSSATTQTFTDTIVAPFNDNVVYDHNGSAATTGAATLTVTLQPGDAPAVETLGELIVWLIQRSRVQADLSEWVALARQLPQPVAGVVDDPDRTYWQVLRDEVLPLAPVSLRWGPNGVRPLVWPWLGLAGRTLRTLENGAAGVVRLPDVQYATPTDDMVAAVEVAYAWSAVADAYFETHVLTAGNVRVDTFASTSGFRWEGGSGEAELLRQRFGAQRVDRVESRWIYRKETAAWVARWRLALLGVGYRRVQIEGPSDLGALDLGDIVAYTDDSLHLTDSPAVVVGRRLTDSGRVGLQLAMRAEQSTLSVGPNPDSGPERPDGTNPDDPQQQQQQQ